MTFEILKQTDFRRDEYNIPSFVNDWIIQTNNKSLLDKILDITIADWKIMVLNRKLQRYFTSQIIIKNYIFLRLN